MHSSHRMTRTTLRGDLLAALPWALLGGLSAAAAILMLYLLSGWQAGVAAGAALGVPLLAGMACGPLARRKALTARVLALAAIALVALSAHAFRPTEQAKVHYRPAPRPEVFVGLDAPVFAALGAAALLAAVALSHGRIAVPGRGAIALGARRGLLGHVVEEVIIDAQRGE